MYCRFDRHTQSKQQGAALLVSMILLIVLTIVVIGSMRNAGLNARMAGNTQMFNSFKNTVDGEAFSQASFFAPQVSGSDITTGKPVAIDSVVAQAIKQTADNNQALPLTVQYQFNGVNDYIDQGKLQASLLDLTQPLNSKIGEFAQGTFVQGSMCQGYGQAIDCKNMMINVHAQKDNIKLKSDQILGFGVIAPQQKGVQAINTDS